jgi:hypothetical protein
MKYTLNNALMASNLEPAELKMGNKVLPIHSHFAKINQRNWKVWSPLVPNPNVAGLN